MKPDSIVEKVTRLFKIGIFAVIPFIVSLGPFVYMNQLPQLASRLFPFKRGLCHAYWAPNFWAIYNFADKIANLIFKQKHGSKSSSTSGLVQDINHTFLPNILPIVTFVLSFIFMIIPALGHIYRTYRNKQDNRSKTNEETNNEDNLIILIIICGFSSFLFGWHVHEKAVLMILIPLSYISTRNKDFASLYFMISLVSGYSLFPLIFRTQEYMVKVLLLILFTFYNFLSLKFQFKNDFKLNTLDKLCLTGIIILETYNSLIHHSLSIGSKLPYLPLMMTSLFCATFIIFCWARFLFLVLIKQTKKSKNE